VECKGGVVREHSIARLVVVQGDAAAEDRFVVNLMETPECRPQDGPAEFSETTGGGMGWGREEFVKIVNLGHG
jgi:hypothetical protein